jgi:hypothetical protein
MSVYEHFTIDELPGEEGYLGVYRATVERLRGETAAELGRQPMPPEKLSMFAVIVAMLPLVALTHPAIPLHASGWGVAVALAAVWLIAYRVQAPRYERFHSHWRQKIAAHHAAEAAPGSALCFIRHDLGR